MAKFKAKAHAFAAVIFLGLMWLGHFATSPAGIALIQQYPKLSVVASIVSSAIAAIGVYFNAQKAGQ